MSVWEIFGLHGKGAIDLVLTSLHFMMLSLLSVGGTLATAPDMQNFLVVIHGWMNDAQFTSSIAIGQAAPGPNVLFVALLGLNVAGIAGAMIALVSIMLPSSLLTLRVGRLRLKRADSLLLRALTSGLSPLTLGLLLSTGWILTAPTRGNWGAIALIAFTIVMMVRTKTSPLVLIAIGALAGILGLV